MVAPKTSTERSRALRKKRAESNRFRFEVSVTQEEKEQLIKRLAELREKLIEGI
jgi:hypothetical protein